MMVHADTSRNRWKLAMELRGLPIPVSVNSSYRNIPSGGRAATRELREFKRDIENWAILNKDKIDTLGKLIENKMLRVDINLLLHYTRVFGRNGLPKRYDVSNRIKTMEDGLLNLIGIDDKWVFWICATKNCIPNHEKEETIVNIAFYSEN